MITIDSIMQVCGFFSPSSGFPMLILVCSFLFSLSLHYSIVVSIFYLFLIIFYYCAN